MILSRLISAPLRPVTTIRLRPGFDPRTTDDAYRYEIKKLYAIWRLHYFQLAKGLRVQAG